MKILIFGRGAIGTQYAWAFEKAGHQVGFYVREGRKAHYGPCVNLEISDGRQKKIIKEQWKVELLEKIDPGQDYDLILLSVNPEQVKAAVEYLAPRVGGATVLFFCNYGGDPLKAVEPIPAAQVVVGFPGAGGGYEGNTLYGMLYKQVQLGKVGGTFTGREKGVRDLFEAAGFQVAVKKDIRSWLLNHYVMNVAMEAEVLKKGSFENVVKSREALGDMLKNMKEMIPYLKARQVPVDISMSVLSLIPPQVFGCLMQKTVYKPGSMAYEAIAHNHFEAGFSVNEILEDARSLGITLPRLEEAVKFLPERTI